MIDQGFYMSLMPLGEHVVSYYKKIESALMYLIGQIAIFDIDIDKFYIKAKSRFETDLNKIRGKDSEAPSDAEKAKFELHVKTINNSFIGKGVRFEMVVSNSLHKLFSQQN
jgi:hypothetical protein